MRPRGLREGHVLTLLGFVEAKVRLQSHGT